MDASREKIGNQHLTQNISKTHKKKKNNWKKLQ